MKDVRSQRSAISKTISLSSMLLALSFLGALLFVLSLPAQAQQPAKIARIGYVSGQGDPKAPGPLVEGFRQGLRDLGYIEEKNILVGYCYIEGKSDSILSLVVEFVQLKVGVLVVTST